jgi:microcystin degradation protein MlrC
MTVARALIGTIIHEANSFSPVQTPLKRRFRDGTKASRRLAQAAGDKGSRGLVVEVIAVDGLIEAVSDLLNSW